MHSPLPSLTLFFRPDHYMHDISGLWRLTQLHLVGIYDAVPDNEAVVALANLPGIHTIQRWDTMNAVAPQRDEDFTMTNHDTRSRLVGASRGWTWNGDEIGRAPGCDAEAAGDHHGHVGRADGRARRDLFVELAMDAEMHTRPFDEECEAESGLRGWLGG